jgi:chitodextrinase
MAGQAPVNVNASAEARDLLSYLYTLMSPSAGLLTGQHNWLESPMGNIVSLALPNSGGKYPAVIGLEVGPISGQDAATAYKQRAAVVDAAKVYSQAGGIPTIMWHCTYPGMPYQWSGGVQRATTEAEFNQIVTPGDPKYNWLIDEMDKLAVHFKTLRDAGVPILFRPWHEMNGYWFWWGKKTKFAALWNLTYERFVKYHGLDNILWVWNPNAMKASDPNIGNYKLFYPGHHAVDILAWDIYLGEFTQSFHDDLYAFGEGKPIALGEVGRLPDMNIMQSKQWRYTWAMAWGEPNFSNENTPENKRQFYSNAYALTRDEVKIITPPPVDTIAPSIPTNVAVTAISRNSVSLTWDASTDNMGVTGYDIMQGNTITGSTVLTNITITNLKPSTTYSFTVIAKDAAGNRSAESKPVIVTTEAEPGDGSVVFKKGINFHGNAVTIEGNAWLAESAAGITISPILRHSGNARFNPVTDSQTNAMLNSDIYSGNTFSMKQALTNGTYLVYLWTVENFRANYRSFHVKLEGIQVTSSPIGLLPLNQWHKYGPYTVTVKDGVLNMELVRVTGDPMLTGMAIYSIDTTTPPPPDTQAPSVPANVIVPAKSHISVSLAWDASTDNIGVTGYDIMQGNTITGSTVLTNITITNLKPSTTYSFTVRAKDAAGNLSAASKPVTVTTTAAPGQGSAIFVKGINMHGSAVTIEGNPWLAESAAGITTSSILRHSGNVSFSPATDSQTNVMLNSDIYSGNTFSMKQSLANGTYLIYLWTVENFKANYRSFHVMLEGIQVTTSPIGSLPLKQWRKHGPYTVKVKDGVLNLELVRVTGDPILTGMAIYSMDMMKT